MSKFWVKSLWWNYSKERKTLIKLKFMKWNFYESVSKFQTIVYVSSCERYFSKLRLIKLWVKINWLMAIVLIKHEYTNISCDTVIHKFAEGSKNFSVIIYYYDRPMRSY